MHKLTQLHRTPAGGDYSPLEARVESLLETTGLVRLLGSSAFSSLAAARTDRLTRGLSVLPATDGVSNESQAVAVENLPSNCN